MPRSIFVLGANRKGMRHEESSCQAYYIIATFERITITVHLDILDCMDLLTMATSRNHDGRI
jgi:hypothetical protein